MRALQRRLAALEASQPVGLSPRVRQWLGWPLTDAEQQLADEQAPQDCADVDTSGLSQEMEAWLGVN